MVNDNPDPQGGLPVPSWLVGRSDGVEQAVRQTAGAWAAAYRERQTFPPPQLVGAGALDILLYGSSDDFPRKLAVRLFANGNLVSFIKEELDYRGVDALMDDYETYAGGWAWGAFESLLFNRAPNSRAVLQRRFTQVLPHLSTLAQVTVIDYDNTRRSALEVLERAHTDTLANCGAAGAGPLEGRIRAALEAMAEATPEIVRDGIVSAMLRLVPELRRLRNPQRFTPENVRRSLESLDAATYEGLTGCHPASLMSEMYAMDRE